MLKTAVQGSITFQAFLVLSLVTSLTFQTLCEVDCLIDSRSAVSGSPTCHEETEERVPTSEHSQSCPPASHSVEMISAQTLSTEIGSTSASKFPADVPSFSVATATAITQISLFIHPQNDLPYLLEASSVTLPLRI